MSAIGPQRTDWPPALMSAFLGRMTSSIAIERLRVFTQPRPRADVTASLSGWQAREWLFEEQPRQPWEDAHSLAPRNEVGFSVSLSGGESRCGPSCRVVGSRCVPKKK